MFYWQVVSLWSLLILSVHLYADSKPKMTDRQQTNWTVPKLVTALGPDGVGDSWLNNRCDLICVRRSTPSRSSRSLRERVSGRPLPIVRRSSASAVVMNPCPLWCWVACRDWGSLAFGCMKTSSVVVYKLILMYRVSIAVKGMVCFFFSTAIRPTLDPCNLREVFFPRANLPEREADHWVECSAEAKIYTFSYTSIPPYVFMAWQKTNELRDLSPRVSCTDRAIPTKRPPLVGEVSANFLCG
jgi:hypothetical protein